MMLPCVGAQGDFCFERFATVAIRVWDNTPGKIELIEELWPGRRGDSEVEESSGWWRKPQY